MNWWFYMRIFLGTFHKLAGFFLLFEDFTVIYVYELVTFCFESLETSSLGWVYFYYQSTTGLFSNEIEHGDLSPADGTDRSISWAQQSWRIRQGFSSGALPVIIMANVSSQLMCILECCSKILTHSHFPDPTVTVHGFSTFGRQRRYSEW